MKKYDNFAFNQSGKACIFFAIVLCMILSGCGEDSTASLVKSARESIDRNENKAAIIQLNNALQKNSSIAEARYLLALALLQSGDMAGAIIEKGKAEDLGYYPESLASLDAKLLLAQGKYDELIEKYSKTNSSNQEYSTDIKKCLVKANLAKGRGEEARVIVLDLIKVSSTDPEVQILNAKTLFSVGRIHDSIIAVDNILQGSDKKVGEAWLLKGEILQKAAYPANEVIAAFKKAIELDKGLVGAHVGLIGALLANGEKKKAQEAIAILKSVAPKNLQTYYLAATLALDQGNIKEAMNYSQQLLKYAPESDRALHLGGVIALRSGDLAMAEVNLGKALSLSPNVVAVRLSMAEAQKQRGNLDQAIETLKPLLEGKDKGKVNLPALAMAAEIKLRQGKIEHAEAYLSRIALANPDDVRSKVALALTKMREGQVQEGINSLRKLSEETTTTEPDLALIGILMRKKDFISAQKAVDKLGAKKVDPGTISELQGRLALLQGKREEARKYFSDALENNPKALTAATGLAMLDVQDRSPEKASQRLDTVIKADPKNVAAKMAQIQLRLKQGLDSPAESKQHLAKLVSEFPDALSPRLLLIALMLDGKDVKQALAVVQSGLQSRPNQPELVDALGQVQELNGEREQAVSTYGKLTSLLPNQPLGALRLADLYMRAGDNSAAISALRRADAVKPGDPEISLNVSERAIAIGNFDYAQSIAKALQAAHRDNPVGWKIEGDVARAQKKWDVAITAYRKAENLGAPNALHAIAMHSTLLAAGHAVEASEYADVWLRKNRSDTIFRSKLGDLAMVRNDFDQALKHYLAVYENAPDNVGAVNNIAWLMVKIGRVKDALPHAENAYRMSRGGAPYADTLAEVYVADGRLEQAIKIQRSVVEQQPNVPVYRLHLAQYLLKGGNKSEAKVELKKILALRQDFSENNEVKKLQAALR